jgi:hypothetical protein
MIEFDPLNGTVITFVRGKATVNLKEALENLEFDEKTPQKISYLIYGQFVWRDCSPISIFDLDLGLFYDEKCEHPVTFVTFTFPKKPIQNGANFKVKVSLTKGSTYMIWNLLHQPILELEKAALPITQNPKWESWLRQQPKQDREIFTKTRMFHVKICGMAREGRC